MTCELSSQSFCNSTLPGPSLQSLCSAAEYICFMTALDEAVRCNLNISQYQERIKPIDEPAKDYDFIVIGAGAGGAAVTGRLAEISNWKILLLEAGEDESAAGQIPTCNEALIGSEIDWHYYTSNETHACLSTNGSCFWPSARSLGGNTAHNGMVYLRGNPKDYDNWADLGNEGWGWNEVLKFYKKQEDNANIDEVGNEFHGTGGPLSVGFFPYISEFGKAFLKASVQSGFGLSKDLNGKNLTGFANIQGSQKHGVRVSSAAAYLRPQRNNKNLDISLKSFVTRIIIEKNTAVGVEYIKNGELKSVRAKREIILSAGTVRSPQLLLLSGIGPRKHLKSKGIKVVHHLPGVGENVHDQVSSSITFTINESDTYINNVPVAKEYLEKQTGPMSTIGESYLVGAACTNKTTPDYPDLQLFVSANLACCAPGEVGALHSQEKRKIVIFVGYVHPKSRGRISLASSNPLDHPIMWGNYLAEPSDLEGLVDGMELTLKFLETDAMRAYNLTLDIEPPAACSNYTIPSREYWKCAVKQNTFAEVHQVGSCKMGPASDPMAVVDPQLRVYGIKNLRVVDASIMPKVTSANTAAPTMMIGERGADFIKKRWIPSSKCQ